MKHGLWLCAVVASLWCGSSVAQSGRGTPAPVRPQPPAPTAKVEFRCPSAGVTVTTKSATSVTEWTSQGADGSDPTLCIRKRGFTTTEQYFGIFGRNIAGASVADLKKSMQELIGGTRNEFSLRYEVQAGSERWTFEDKWVRVGIETLTVGGRRHETILMEQMQQNLTRPFKGTARWWLDPSSGILLKRTVMSTEPNYPWGENFEVTGIAGP